MKKLLILGASSYEIGLVKRAKAKGIHTIVTDQYLNRDLSPAKLIADELWDIDWSDIDSLAEECIKHGVDGVLAGYSEFRVENLIKLTTRLGLPCYCTMEQLEVTRDKVLFKNVCRLFGVPVVPQYNPDIDLNDSAFPVIVKPVDRGGSIGITVAYNQKEYERSKKYALSLSPSKQIIVEQFMQNYTKIDLYYIILNGNYYYFGSTDTIMDQRTAGIEIMQREWHYNSEFEKLYLETIDNSVKKLMEGLEFKHGYITFSAFARGNEIYFFETGYRLTGEQSYHFCAERFGFDYLDVMIDEALSIPTHYVINKYRSPVCSRILNFHALRSGRIASIRGVDKLTTLQGVEDVLLVCYIGEKIEVKNGAHPYLAMVTITAPSDQQLDELSSFVRMTFEVLDDEGSSLVFR